MTVAALSQLALNRNAEIEILKVGEAQRPVLIVNNAFEGAEALVEYATQADFNPPSAPSRYPGLNARLPDVYMSTLLPAFRTPIMGVFGAPAGINIRKSFGFLGLSIAHDETMPLEQKLPHADSLAPDSYASVHYLSTGFGGTAFYRHRSTGLETLKPSQSHMFVTTRDAEAANPKGSNTETIMEYFEEIGRIDGAFNRLIIYPANLLHSACLPAGGKPLSTDPRQGRLSANGFFNT